MAPIFAVLFGTIESVTMVVLLEIFVSVQLMSRIIRNDTQWRFVIPLGLSAALLNSFRHLPTRLDRPKSTRKGNGNSRSFHRYRVDDGLGSYRGEKGQRATACSADG
jgi:hypothetical protein